jgi:hypothetical protein
MVNSYWLEFPVDNTWVVRNPTTGMDDQGRYYWADGLNPPGYTTGDRIVNYNTASAWSSTTAYTVGQFAVQAGTTYECIANNTNQVPPNATYWRTGSDRLVLGIPAPGTAPGVTVSGGTTPVETRGYVYTWVSVSGEEGPPSPPTVVQGQNANGIWHIALTAPGPLDMANRTLSTLRIYRTVTNTQGVATFFFVVELPIATLSYDDAALSATVALNAELISTNWSGPPADLNGLVGMPNGMIAGFRFHNEIWFCEPYRPHAWPPQYVIGVESPIVGLGVQQQSLVIMTEGWTYIATGISPTSMTLTKVSNLNPCTSMGSIVSSADGVLYTSGNGLMVVNAGVEVNGTANLVRKDEWPTMLYLPSLHAVYINRSYLAFSSPNDIGVFQGDAFQVEVIPPPGDPVHDAFQTKDFTGTRDGVLISLLDERASLMRIHSDLIVHNVIQDLWTGEPMVLLDDGWIYHLDVRYGTPRISDYLWRSKIFQTQYKENWAAAKVFYGPPPGVSGTPDAPTYFRFYADGRMILQRTLPASGQQFRLPSGYKSDFIQFELQGQLEIYNVQIATSVRELRNA